MRPVRFDPAERRERALTFLAQLTVLNAGYRARGVYGWAHPDDFHLLAGQYDWSRLLVELTAAHDADSTRVGRGAGGSTTLYRIAPAGMREVGRILGEVSPDIREPAPADETNGRLYVSVGAWWALDALRDASLRDGNAPLTLREVRDRIGQKYGHCRPTYRVVLHSDLLALVTAGLAAEWDNKFSVTSKGSTAELLAWWGHHPETGIFTDHGKGTGPLLKAISVHFRFVGDECW